MCDAKSVEDRVAYQQLTIAEEDLLGAHTRRLTRNFSADFASALNPLRAAIYRLRYRRRSGKCLIIKSIT